MAKSEWKWFGFPGHLIVANSCRFHLHTQVGEFRISTVGEYFSQHSNKIKSIGADENDIYETMVFKSGKLCDCGCGSRDVLDWSSIYCECCGTVSDAQKQHESICKEYDKGD